MVLMCSIQMCRTPGIFHLVSRQVFCIEQYHQRVSKQSFDEHGCAANTNSNCSYCMPHGMPAKSEPEDHYYLSYCKGKLNKW